VSEHHADIELVERQPSAEDAAVGANPVGPDGTDPPATSRRVWELPPPPKSADPAAAVRLRTDDAEPAGTAGWVSRLRSRESAGFSASFLVHFAVVLILGLLVVASEPGGTFEGLVASLDATDAAELATLEALQAQAVVVDSGFNAVAVASAEESLDPVELVDPTAAASAAAAAPRCDLEAEVLAHGLHLALDADVRGALDGRRGDARARLARQGGGNAASEQAVERGLRWLMAHQRDDGSWHFNHQKSPCRGHCRNPGTEESTTAATALVLLPFLGAGYTHREGEYRDVVERGLYYLQQRAVITREGCNLQEGTMYGQGLATIALCEAYAMTKDPALKEIAQRSLDYIVYAQDTKGGGWRYTPGEPGDTTVTGWQLMGLKSGQMAGLIVPSPSIALAQRFLGSVQSEQGALYGYMSPQPRQTTTAVGLLLRMYTGWHHDHPALARGVEHLAEWGPTDDNMYHNYYATQVMHHWQGPLWETWNQRMRDYLIATQADSSHEAGSWYFAGGYGDRGGRLYNTAMAVMTLEVYYRHMPLYGQAAVEDAF